MQALSSGDAFSLLLAALIVLPLALAICIKLPQTVALGFVAILFLFSSSTWGQIDAENTLYSRGTGLLYFSLLNLLLWLAGAAIFIRQVDHAGARNAGSPFPLFLFAFGFMLIAHSALGLLTGIDVLQILSYSGIINVINMLVFCSLLTGTLQDQQGQRRLLLLILGVAALRAVFGMVRYLLLGGDSANPYRNFENLDIKIFYFDIADNFVAAIAAFCIAWLLLMPTVKLSLSRRLVLIGLLALEIAAVALSFRRSSLIGLVLMAAILLWQLPWRGRLQLLFAGSGAIVAAAGVFLRERLQFNSNSGSFLASLLYDIGADHNTEVSRFYELEAAAQSLQGHWLFGLGSWGTFYGNEDILDYHFGKFDFVHSGFGHLILKSGLAGLALFLALLLVCALHYVRIRPRLQGNAALLADAGAAGMLFWLPTLLIGTPIIEFRTMLLIGLCLAMPYLALVMAAQRIPNQGRLYAVT